MSVISPVLTITDLATNQSVSASTNNTQTLIINAGDQTQYTVTQAPPLAYGNLQTSPDGVIWTNVGSAFVADASGKFTITNSAGYVYPVAGQPLYWRATWG